MTTRRFCIVCLLLATARLWGTEARLHLKARTHQAAIDGTRQAGVPKYRPFSRPHILVQFRRLPQDSEVLELKNRGVQVLEYVPDSGLIVAADDETALEGLEVAAAGPLFPADKLSTLVRGDTKAYVVEFHRDVDPADALALIHDSGLEPRYHPDLLPNHVLVEAPARRVTPLAQWDEVAYIYPASDDLVAGTRLNACAGPVTVYGNIGQLAATAGDGWDGAGRGSVTLGYYFRTLTDRIPRAAAQGELLRAMTEWGKCVDLNFLPAPSPAASRTLSVLFASRGHGDAYPFDGPGHVLAHTYYPAPPNPEPVAGDIHFDADENWMIGDEIDLFSVALHEAGHALGLAHSDQPGTVMYPYYRRVTTLAPGDIAAIRELYAARPGTEDPKEPDPPPAEPKPPEPPQPPQKPGDPPPPADPVAPALTITSPGSTSVLTYEASISVRGTAIDNVGVVKVTWEETLGNRGDALGTGLWQIPAIPVRVGANTITIRAFDAAGNSGWRSLTVTRKRRN